MDLRVNAPVYGLSKNCSFIAQFSVQAMLLQIKIYCSEWTGSGASFHLMLTLTTAKIAGRAWKYL